MAKIPVLEPRLWMLLREARECECNPQKERPRGAEEGKGRGELWRGNWERREDGRREASMTKKTDCLFLCVSFLNSLHLS